MSSNSFPSLPAPLTTSPSLLPSNILARLHIFSIITRAPSISLISRRPLVSAALFAFGAYSTSNFEISDSEQLACRQIKLTRVTPFVRRATSLSPIL